MFWDVRNSSPRFPCTPPCADMLPDPRGQNAPSAGRGLPSGLVVNSGSMDHSIGPAPTQLLHMVPGTMLPTRTHTLVSGGRDPHWSLGPTLVPGPTARPRYPTSPAEAPTAELTREHGIEPRTK
jgi:hypothetical protein